MKKRLLIIGGLFLAGALIYSNTFSSSFHFDDTLSIVENPLIMNIRNLGNIWNFWPTRFVTYFSVALNYHFGRLDVFGYHLFNLITHVSASFMVFWLISLPFLTPGLQNKNIIRNSIPISLFAGLIFLAHPIQTQGVTYIIQRAVSLASLFYLLSLCCYVKSRLLKQNTRSAKLYYAGSLFACFLAMFSKEMAITLPFMIILYEAYFLKTEQKLPWKKLTPFLILLAVIPLTMWLTRSVDFLKMQRMPETLAHISPGQYLLTEFRVLITYIRLVFLPFNQNLDYDYPLVKSIFEIPALAGIIVLSLIVISALRLRRNYSMISFAILWFLITLLPESSFLPISDVIFEHRLYLPMFGLSLFMASGLFYLLPQRRKLAILILSLLAVFYGIKSYNRNAVWKDEFTLWGDTSRKSHHKGRPYHNLGNAFQSEERFDEAIPFYNTALELSPQTSETYYNRGNAYRGKGDFDKAIADFNKALQINPLSEPSYGGRGGAWRGKGDFDKAIADFTQAITLNPNNFRTLNDRANVYSDKGEYTLAVADYSKAIQVNPIDPDIYFNRANTYQKAGDLNAAIADYAKVVKLNPAYDAAYFALGNAFRDKGDLAGAIVSYSKAIAVNPLNAGALHNRAAAYLLTGQLDKSWEDVRKQRELGAAIQPELLKQLQEASKKLSTT